MELENALGELVAAGLVNSDSFAGLRALLKPRRQTQCLFEQPARRDRAR